MKHSEYLEAKTRTANSAQLHLMLLDGALRHAREAEKGVLRGEETAYHTHLLRALSIVGELLAGVRHSNEELNKKLAQLYTFIYTRLTSVYVNGDKQMIAEALRVLEAQRETWRLAVDRVAADPPAGVPRSAPPKPHMLGGFVDTPTEGLSIEA